MHIISCCLNDNTIAAMKRNSRTALLTLCSLVVAGGVLLAQQIGDVPGISAHLNQADIESGRVSLQETVQHGERLFKAFFNKLDGHGRPATQTGMVRTTGPDAHTCIACHNHPRPGGNGDFSSNVFVNGEDIRHLKGPDTAVKSGDELSIVPAIAGGSPLAREAIAGTPWRA